jgi:hypothetical protein
MKDPTTTAKSVLHPAINTLLASLRTGDPKIHNGFGLWPVFADCRPEPAYLTLVEALALPGFKITEVSEGGSVPSLRVINETPQHVLLFDGEELKGAKQNRILNTTILIAAGTSLDVPVSCTEQGRWSYDRRVRQQRQPGLRRAAQAQVGGCRLNLKAHAIHASNQSAVWQEIESLHVAAKTSDSSKTRAMKDAYNERQKELDDFTREVVLPRRPVRPAGGDRRPRGRHRRAVAARGLRQTPPPPGRKPRDGFPDPQGGQIQQAARSGSPGPLPRRCRQGGGIHARHSRSRQRPPPALPLGSWCRLAGR